MFLIFSVPSALQRPLYLENLYQSILYWWWLCELEKIIWLCYVLPQPGKILGQVVPLGAWLLVLCMMFIMEKCRPF